ncbi:MAG: VOC family protein [Candidatus Binatia bacterium]|nr:VOC family protein [Candidatus Binatia bacterium]MDG1958393.1 VOC family protein [Candidatus Binatia bacterium]MDG2009320.1 VOC family protein [Candidatus Binatia bacterium]
MIESIDHIIFAVEDLAAAATDLQGLLGREPSWKGEHPGYGTANILFRFEKIYVELLAAVGEGPVADSVREHLASQGEGVFAVALRTADAASCVEVLRSRGLSPSDPMEGAGATADGRERRWKNIFLPRDETLGVNVFVIEHLTPNDLLPESRVCHEGSVAGIDHVVILSADADRTRDLYRDIFGLRLALDREFPDWGARQLFFKVDGVVLEVGASLKKEPDPAKPDEFWGICWRTLAIDQAHARLTQSGWDVSGVRSGRKPGTRVCTVRSGTHGVATLLLATEPRSAKTSPQTDK